MALTPQQKQEFFEKIRQDTITGIKRDHDRFAYKVMGWCRNKFRSAIGMSDDSKMAAGYKLGAKLALMPLEVPVLKPILDMVISAGISAAQGKSLAWDMDHAGDRDEKVQVSGEWVVLKGAEAFKDAVRKIDDAANNFNKRGAPQHCDDFCEWVKSFYYWRYRLDRLRYYHALLQGYLTAVDGKLADAERFWLQEEFKLKQEGPRIFDDWSWHHKNCRDRETCVFPWDIWKKTAEISGPVLNKTPANLAAMKLRPIVPPKPHFGPPPQAPPRPLTPKPLFPPRKP
jgi:hypothetical protein